LNKSNPLVSVCIPVYNCDTFIAQAIESVINQSFPDWELLILDNASTDRTLEVIKRYDDTRIRLIQNDHNLGLEGNWNKCLAEACGEYIKLLPADDWIHTDCLEQQVNAFDKPGNESVALVCCARNIINPDGKPLLVRKFPGPERKINGIDAIRLVLRAGTNKLGEPGSILFKRELLQKTGVFDGRLAYVIDVHLWLRMLLYGDLYILSKPLAAFRLSSGSASVELAVLQSTHFTTFIRDLAGDPRYRVRWFDQVSGIMMSRLLGMARKLFYLLTIRTKQ